jgi:hypothetical protein
MRPRRWIATLLTAILTLTACTITIPPASPGSVVSSPAAPDAARTAYILCAGTDESQGTQDRCQQRVWGVSFREDDSRWDCLHMGNRVCGPDTMIVTTTTTR